MNPWKVILATLIIFTTGVITGGLLVQRALQGRAVFRPQRPDFPPEPWMLRREFLQLMDRQLGLSPNQYDRIGKILEQSQERTRALMGPVRQKMNEEVRQVREKIRAELNPEQQRQFEELMRSRPRRWQMGGPPTEGRLPPPIPGPLPPPGNAPEDRPPPEE